MTTPGQDPDDGFDLADSFQVLITRIGALEGAISQQTNITRAQLDAQLRMSTGGGNRGANAAAAEGLMAQYQPRMRESVLRELSRQGGLPSDSSAGMTRVSGLSALASLQGLQRYGAQRLGEWIAGEPLYGKESGARGGATAGGQTPGGGAPAAPLPSFPQPFGQGCDKEPLLTRRYTWTFAFFRRVKPRDSPSFSGSGPFHTVAPDPRSWG